MMTIRATLILLSLLTFLPLSHAQLINANKLFQLCRYSEAIPLYTKIAEQDPDPKLKAIAITRLADCYRLTNNAEMASEWYSNALQLAIIDPVNYLYYGQALQSKGNYLSAKSAFLRYSQLVPTDPRGSLLASYCDLPEKWESLPPAFEIHNVESINSKYSDFGPAFYKNNLIFTSDRRENYFENNAYGWTNNSYFQMYSSQQQNPQNPFSEMNAVNSFSKNLNQPYHDGPAAFSKDGGIIYITRSYNDRAGKKNRIKNHLLKIFYAKTNGKNWSKEKPFFLNSKEYSVAHPGISPDGKLIFFSSDKPGGFGASDLWYCTKQNEGWSAPVNAGKEVNSFGNEVFPFILNDSTVYFASNGLPGYGGLDVFVTKKKNGQWQTPQNQKKPLNSSYDDFSFIADATDTRGFFSSNRPEGIGSDDIYAFKRLKVIPEVRQVTAAKPKTFSVSGYVKDKNSALPIAGATVYLLNVKTGRVKVLRTNAAGLYKSFTDKGDNLVVRATQAKYISDCLSFLPAVSNAATSQNAPYDLLLEKLEVNKVYKLENFYFDYEKWNIRPDAMPELNKLVKIMKENPITVEVASHTDCHGTTQENDVLSQKRAEAVVNYLFQKGISRERLIAKGYGERKLLNKCADGVECSPEEHQANRRTEFKIISVSPSAPQKNLQKITYKEGEEISRKVLASDFFGNCLDGN